MKNLEIIKMNSGNLAINIDDKELSLLKEIAKDANQNFVTLNPEGVGIGEEVYSEIYCQITEYDKHHYRWTDGKIKEIKHGLKKEEARALDFLDGVDLTLNLIRPEQDEDVIFSCPRSTYWNFSKYVYNLLQKNLTPKHVVTRIKILMRQFEIGKPVPTATFEAVGLFNGTPNIVDVEVITSEKETSQTQEEKNQELPKSWKD
jgi:hypothetical protein